MAEDFAELGIEGVNKLTDKYHDRVYDKMSGARRHPSQPPSHRGYDDDPYNEYDDERPRGSSARYNESNARDRYVPANYQQQAYDQPRYTSERSRRYDDGLPPPSTREQAAPYVAAGASAGALAPYPKKRNDRDDRYGRDNRRRRSPSSSSSRSDSRDRSYSRERSRDDRSRSGKTHRDSPSMAFDKSELGIGAGIAGALIGGYVGREVGDKHKSRGTALGAIVGGIGANLLEHRWKIYQEEKKEQERQEEGSWDRKQKYGGRDGGGGYDDGRYGRDDGSDSRRRRRSR